jgi:argininosuccinate lyase
MMHISRLAEEIIIWNSEEFSIIKLPNAYTTGSSMMPQKRNPDFAEISRGKTGRVYGNLISLLTTMKALPMTYNRDMQEDKEGFFDSYDTLIAVLGVFKGMLEGIELTTSNMKTPMGHGMLLATDIADYLVSKGLTFRDAYSIVSDISDYIYSSKKQFSELTLAELNKFSNLFENDVKSITYLSSISSRDIPGGTSPTKVSEAILNAQKRLRDII